MALSLALLTYSTWKTWWGLLTKHCIASGGGNNLIAILLAHWVAQRERVRMENGEVEDEHI